MKSLSIKLGVLLMGLMILGYAVVCNAECAWMLWKRMSFYNIKKDSRSTEWMIIVAVPKYEQCMETLKDKFKKEKEFWEGKARPWKVIGSELGYIMLISQNEKGELSDTGEINFECYPDTIDPRK